MSNIDKQAYRADGGDISTGRLKEIADNPYGDEEKCWLAKRMLTLLVELDSLESFRTAFMEYSDKTDWVQTDKRFDVIKPWGKHRADVLRDFIEHLESKLKAKGKTWAAQDDHINLQADRIESLEKKNSELGKALGEANKRIAELAVQEVKLPERYDIEMWPVAAPHGEWYARDDVLAALKAVGIRISGEL
ncbi:hypothetical protein ACI2JI_04530 [Enterobacter cancerogenus]|uniref:hypothetical protein n=1 Tax=Enterobacter cancerogenus TaxID=69218 RepID=UPI00384A8D9C